MKHYITLTISALLLLLLIYGGYALKETYTRERLESLTFSNTMKWDENLLDLTHAKTHYIDNWEEYITIPPPPTNSSQTTRDELNTLLSYKKLRTPEKIKEIIDQADIHTATFNGQKIINYLDEKKYPLTSKALKQSFEDISIIVLQAKLKFNRVRPSILEPLIDPVLDIPGHPAYPSGHSTQSYFLAYFFSELQPEKKEQFMKEAERIAKNREIAGLHYPSDTEAGKILAQQFMELLLKQKEFVSLINEAKKEW